MRRKAKRARWKVAPLIVLAIVANGVVGLLYSPLTSLTHARVEGAADWDRARILHILERLHDVPCAQVRPREVETAVLQDPEVRSAELMRNVFGYATLIVAYRTPVVRIRNTNNLALAIDGVLYPSHRLPDDLPTLELPPGEPRILMTIAGNWQPVPLAYLAARCRELWPSEQLAIQLDDRGSVCLNMSTGRVVLGSPNDLDKKLAVLQERLRQNPSELQTVEELNLTVPDSPAIVRKKAKKP